MSAISQEGRLRNVMWGGRHLAMALLLHGAVIGALYWIGPRQASVDRQERQFSATAQVASQMRTQQRVQDLEQIKALLEQSRASAPPAAQAEPVQFAAAPLPEKDQQLLEKARELAESIAEIDEQNRAEELAKVLGISEEQAHAQVASEQRPATAAAPENAAAGADGAAGEIERLEAQARGALERRQKQLARASGGVQLEGALHSRSQSGASDGALPLGERIEEFMNRGIALRDRKDSSYAHPWRGIFTAGEGRMAQVDAAAMVKGLGRSIGAGGEFANRLYVNNWYVIGPFAGRKGQALFDNPAYPPEQGVYLDAAYRGKDGRILKWRYISKPEYPLVPPDYSEDGVWYGYTELMMDSAQEVSMWIGADDDAQVWVNDKLVWRGGNVNKRWFWREIYDTRNTYIPDLNLAEGARRVQLNKGRNKVFFKLSNGPLRTFFSLVVTE